MKKNKIILVSVLLLAGCTTQTPISTVDDHFICHGRAGYWSEWAFGVGGEETNSKCQQKAISFCAEKENKPAVILSSEFSNSGFAKPSSAKVMFSCNTQEEIEIAKQLESKQREEYTRRSIESVKVMCEQSFGFKPNTPDMSHCLLQVQMQREQNANVESSNTAIQKTNTMLEQQQGRQQKAKTNAEMLNGINKAVTPPVPIR